MPYGRIQGQGQGHDPIQGSRIKNLQSREVDRQSPTGLIFMYRDGCYVCSQQDAQEFLISLLEGLQDDLNHVRDKNKKRHIDCSSEVETIRQDGLFVSLLLSLLHNVI